MKPPIGLLTLAALLAITGCAWYGEDAPAEISTGALAGPAAGTRFGGATADTLRLAKNVTTWKEIRERNVVMQQFDYSCGAAAMATLLRYYFDDDVPERAILIDMTQSLNEEEFEKRKLEGFSLLDLKNFAERRGYQAVGVRLELNALPLLRGPVLVYLELPDSKHFAILRGVREDRVYLADPSRGNLRMRVDRFATEWPSGIALVLGKPGFGTPSDTALSVDQIAPFRVELDAARSALYAEPNSARSDALFRR